MNAIRPTKKLVYLLIIIMLGTNQSVLASMAVIDNLLQGNQLIRTFDVHSDDDFHHDVSSKSMQQDSSHRQDVHHKHSGENCDGFDSCNHCVNLVNNFTPVKLPAITNFIPGPLATYYNIYLPQKNRPPQYA